MKIQNSEIAELENLRLKSAQMLAAIGICNQAQLAEVEAINAYRLLKLRGHNPSLILVLAIQGARDDVHGSGVSSELKAELQREAAD